MEASDFANSGNGSSPDETLEAVRARNAVQYDVFISYSTKNTEAAERLAGALGAAGFAYFYAPNDITRFLFKEAENQFVMPLLNAQLRSCQCVALVSGAYLDSPWCELELMGAFNLSIHGGGRALHLSLLEDVKERLIGQLHGYGRSGTFGDLIKAVAAAKQSCKLRVGDDLGVNPPKSFVDLPLRKYYEPPGHAPRAPWRFDARTPRGYPGGPSYEVYQELVREYMVQMKKLGGPPRLFLEDDEQYKLKLQIPNLPEKYAFINERAYADAARLLREGISPTPWRPSFSEIWRDAEAAQAEGDSPTIQRRFGLVEFWEGNWSRALEHFERAVQMEDPPDSANVAYLAASYYQSKDYRKAVELLEPFADTNNYLVSKVLAMSLAKLGRKDVAALHREIILGIEPGFTTLKERTETWFVNNDDLDHWIEGLLEAGFE